MISEEIEYLESLDMESYFKRLKELVVFKSDNPKETFTELYKSGITKISSNGSSEEVSKENKN